MKVFLTGAAGFIGTALGRELAARGHDVIRLVRRPETASDPPGVETVVGDLAAADGLEAARPALERAEAVAHLAAVRRDWGLDDDTLRRINVTSGARLIELAPRAQRFLLVSSVAVYGHSRGSPTDERSPFAPSKRYGISKVEAERTVTEAAARTGTPLTIVRPGVVYGPGDTYGMVANLARLLARGRFRLVGPGTSRLNFLYIDDLARGLVQTLSMPAAAGEAFILAGPEPVPVRRLAETVARAVGRELPRLGVPEPIARLAARLLEGGHRLLGLGSEPFLTRAKVDLFTRDDLYDTGKARERLGFAPRVGLDDGIPRAVAWLRSSGHLS